MVSILSSATTTVEGSRPCATGCCPCSCASCRRASSTCRSRAMHVPRRDPSTVVPDAYPGTQVPLFVPDEKDGLTARELTWGFQPKGGGSHGAVLLARAVPPAWSSTPGSRRRSSRRAHRPRHVGRAHPAWPLPRARPRVLRVVDAAKPTRGTRRRRVRRRVRCRRRNREPATAASRKKTPRPQVRYGALGPQHLPHGLRVGGRALPRGDHAAQRERGTRAQPHAAGAGPRREPHLAGGRLATSWPIEAPSRSRPSSSRSRSVAAAYRS